MSIESLDRATDRVTDGARVYIGNFGAQLFCVGHQLVRAGRRDLDLVISSGGLLLDQLLGAGVARSATFAHCWSPVGPAPAWNFRRLAESGSSDVQLHEMTLGMLSAALTAGAWGVPFAPVAGLDDTGFVTGDWTGGRLAHVESPFGASTIVSAEVPDIAFVHVDLADIDGNGCIRGPLGDAVLAAQAARTTVLVAEEIVDAGAVVRAGVSVPGLFVDAVVHVPGAVRPDGAIGRYERDVAAYESYSANARTPDGFADWLRHEVLT